MATRPLLLTRASNFLCVTKFGAAAPSRIGLPQPVFAVHEIRSSCPIPSWPFTKFEAAAPSRLGRSRNSKQLPHPVLAVHEIRSGRPNFDAPAPFDYVPAPG